MSERGFTFIEMVVTLALLGVLGMAAMPLYQLAATRTKEAELKQALRQIRGALDQYKSAVDAGQVAKDVTESGYPASLDVLATGVENSKDINHARLVFLRRVPRDPFSTDPALPAAGTWALRSYGSPPDEPSAGPDIYDVASRSPLKAINGTPYKDW